MPTTLPNLWPDDFGQIAVLTPVAILRQQGAGLGEKTRNIVIGRVSTFPEGQGFRQEFSIHCPPLEYATPLLFVRHGIELYPAAVEVLGNPIWQREAKNPEELSGILKEVFASEGTKRIVASLMAQSVQ